MDDSSQKADNRVDDNTARMLKLVWAFIVTNQRTVFSVAVQLLYHMCHLTMTHILRKTIEGY